MNNYENREYPENEREYENQKTLDTRGKEDSLKGKFNHAAGKVQRKVGHAIGNHEMEAKGTARELGGKVQETGGKVEQKVDKALRSDETV